MSSFRSSRTGVLLLLVSAAIGFVLALYAYFAPLTGVTKTLGALAVIVVCAVLAVMALMLGAASTRGARVMWRALILVALASTAFAALLLHQWWICAAIGVGVVGLILDLMLPVSANRAAYL